MFSQCNKTHLSVPVIIKSYPNSTQAANVNIYKYRFIILKASSAR